ncbi:hypothetical protein [Pelosinus baikalensis]|uniref:Uncharacterized protein n=1 Tax=Pelosinus baikalensis TaxID=2892015 RepID=A0ABS8HWV5_9FIRM|nr:hypothetical protein [Pelosinus baikalensis]MCC5467638.1 hypothetical protein [Pelosinus baikalensis]
MSDPCKLCNFPVMVERYKRQIKKERNSVILMLIIIFIFLLFVKFESAIQFDLSEKNITAYKTTWWGFKKESYQVKLIKDQWHIKNSKGNWILLEYDSNSN